MESLRAVGFREPYLRHRLELKVFKKSGRELQNTSF